MSDWQPIETAPKDGTRILAWIASADWDVGEDVSSPRWTRDPFIAAVEYLNNEWWPVESFHTGATCVPTHWQSLPGPPVRIESQKETDA